MKATLVMDAFPRLDVEHSSWLEKMVGLMFGITIIDKIKLHFPIKCPKPLCPVSKFITLVLATRSMEEKLLLLEMKMGQ